MSTIRIHVVPVGDLDVHTAQDNCWCYPTETKPGVWTHNARDCREAHERATGEPHGDGWFLVAEKLDDPDPPIEKPRSFQTTRSLFLKHRPLFQMLKGAVGFGAYLAGMNASMSGKWLGVCVVLAGLWMMCDDFIRLVFGKVVEDTDPEVPLDPRKDEMRWLLGQIYIARNITLDEERVKSLLKVVDQWFREENSQ